MPDRAFKACKVPGCIGLTHAQWCEEHAKDKAVTGQRDRWRGTAASRGYDSQWKRIRIQALKRDCYLCQICLCAGRVTSANTVDHIIPIVIDPSRRLDLTNLQTLCDAAPHNCHAVKTAEDARKYNYQ